MSERNVSGVTPEKKYYNKLYVYQKVFTGRAYLYSSVTWQTCWCLTIDLIDYVHVYPGLKTGQLLTVTLCHGLGTAVRAHVSVGAVDNGESSSFDQGER